MAVTSVPQKVASLANLWGFPMEFLLVDWLVRMLAAYLVVQMELLMVVYLAAWTASTKVDETADPTVDELV